ncbi:MAG: ATP-binding protein [Clostridiales bacterium]|nr:ATP-binding protein [Clostridiales bacterium]
MLKRKFLQTLLDWKLTKGKECLLVKGARQIGKTYIIDKFGRENYGNYIYVNFFTEPKLKDVFEGSLAAEEIYKRLSVFFRDAHFVENDTLIFLDEIQECPNARTALKFLAIDGRFDVIASGSLLGINYKQVSSIPVGYERQVEMHSLDFEEFLWAIGVGEQTIDYMRSFFESKEKIPPAVNEQMLSYMREYMIVGGMPEVVNTYLSTKHYGEVHNAQKKITDAYLEDIAKYASTSEKPKARNCFLSIPRQLAKENKKFQFSAVESGGRARKYENSLEWLRDANLIRYCNNVSTPQLPLVAYVKPDQFKIYLNDIGLLVSMYGFEMKQAILTGALKGAAKGGIYENLIADILIKKGLPLYYYKNDSNSQEIEFLLTVETEIVPVEVKSTNGSTISLNNFLKEFEPSIGYKFIAGNIGVADNKVTLPLYMAMFL